MLACIGSRRANQTAGLTREARGLTIVVRGPGRPGARRVRAEDPSDRNRFRSAAKAQERRHVQAAAREAPHGPGHYAPRVAVGPVPDVGQAGLTKFESCLTVMAGNFTNFKIALFLQAQRQVASGGHRPRLELDRSRADSRGLPVSLGTILVRLYE